MNIEPHELCLDPRRREQIRARGHNGIDYLDVSDDLCTLTVYLLRPAPEDLAAGNVLIEGGPRSRKVTITELQFCSVEDPDEQDCVRIALQGPGDHSLYTLRIVELSEDGEPTDNPFHAFDPRYSSLQFHFFRQTAPGMDCVDTEQTETPPPLPIDINYLAKDYATFRQLALDRMALIMPQWTERHTADEGIAVIDVLAYTADYLSYYQDAVATEAYLATARQRISVRRHVRLLDYPMHEGCNARTWIAIQTDEDIPSLQQGNRPPAFVSGFDGPGIDSSILNSSARAALSSPNVKFFLPLAASPISLRHAHNRILFYTWGDHQCHLPKGTTGATLEDTWVEQPEQQAATYAKDARQRSLSLRPGDYLLLEEALGPQTGVSADADPSRRWVVRLTSVHPGVDPLNELPIVEVTWAKADALPFDLWLSTIGPAPHCKMIKHVSVARGNIFAADEGNWMWNEPLGTVPLAESAAHCLAEGRSSALSMNPGRFRPQLSMPQLVWRVAPSENLPASSVLSQDPRAALPEIKLISIAPRDDGSGSLFSFAEYANPALFATRLTQQPPDAETALLRERLPKKLLQLLEHFDPHQPIDPGLAASLLGEMDKHIRNWTPRRDLLSSASSDRDFVVEMDDNQFGNLRFGDGSLGQSPQAGESFAASYRVGSGAAGNVGPETIRQMVFPGYSTLEGVNVTVNNPLPAQGGVDPEPVEEVRMYAPGSFLSQLDRAITTEDYTTLAERNPAVQRAAASLVWTGNRYEVTVALDPLGTDVACPELLQEVEAYLSIYRRIGHDVRVVGAVYVPLDLVLCVRVAAHYLTAHVKRSLLQALGSGRQPDGSSGFFHPDNLSFGQSIYASRIIAAAQAVEGVESVSITLLERLFDEEHESFSDGVLFIGPLEIPQLDNDAASPERGRLRLDLRGGL